MNEDTCFVPATQSRLRVMRHGHNIIRSAKIPKPIVVVDTREKQPLPLYANHRNWIGGEGAGTMKTGDYTVQGMESLLALERKSLTDLAACTVFYRERFLAACARLARFRWKAILVEATFEDIKGGLEQFGIPSEVHPNSICGMLDAIEAKFGASPSSTPPEIRILRQSAPRAGSQSISPTGGWNSRATAGY